MKEDYFYLDATPTHSYLKALYKYPQREFPYARLVEENRRRGKRRLGVRARRHRRLRRRPLLRRHRRVRQGDTGRRADPHHDREPRPGGGAAPRAADALVPQHLVVGTERRGLLAEAAHRAGAGRRARRRARVARPPPPRRPTARRTLLFTDNETNAARLFGADNPSPYVKDAFHEYVVHGRPDAVNPARRGHEGGRHYRLRRCPQAGAVTFHLRLTAGGEPGGAPAGRDADAVFAARIREADAFYRPRIPATLGRGRAGRRPPGVRRPALVEAVLPLHRDATGSTAIRRSRPRRPRPAGGPQRATGAHLYNRDVISMPDKWEYPWYAAWDLAFHMIPFATHRSAVREGAARAVHARVVHAPERPAAGVRVRVRRREPAGARVGGVARLQDDRGRAARATGSSCRACSRSSASTSPGG